MNPSSRLKNGRKLPAIGLLLQLFAVILLPLTILLVVITFGSISIHQRAMRNMVGERDAVAVKAAASALDAQIGTRLIEMSSMSELFSTNLSQPISGTLGDISYLMPDFEAGVAVFSQAGELLAQRGDQSAWDAWLADPGWSTAFSQLAAQPGQLILYPNPLNGEQYGFLSAIPDSQNILVGAFSINQLAHDTLNASLPSDGQLSILLVGADGQILYHAGNLSDQSADHPGIAEALQGQSGTLYVKVGRDEHVTAYSPVASAGWALVTEESWEALSTPALQASQVAPLVLVPAVLIMLLAVWFGARQVVRPLRLLEARTATLASGDYQSIRKPVGGISEIQQLQNELVDMADRVSQAQRSLHGYIGAITEAQEDERRRLARELHDDTLQALIALKQRVQLAGLEQAASSKPDDPASSQLDEIAALTEQTIENLRRLTRAMRPVYLEDLGLVAALEMLARETGQSAGITIDFHHQGIEIRLPASNELALYRIAQEALNNLARHARASTATVSINYTSRAVKLVVRDDGMGFSVPGNLSQYAGTGHYGLLGLRERAELIGAELEIESGPGKGTRISVTLPVQTNESE